MMASRFFKSRDEQHHGRLYNLSEKGFAALANGYRRGIDFVFGHLAASRLRHLLRDRDRHRLPVRYHSERVLSAAGHRHSLGPPRPDRTSFHDMYRLQQEVGKLVMADPAVDT